MSTPTKSKDMLRPPLRNAVASGMQGIKEQRMDQADTRLDARKNYNLNPFLQDGATITDAIYARSGVPARDPRSPLASPQRNTFVPRRPQISLDQFTSNGMGGVDYSKQRPATYSSYSDVFSTVDILSNKPEGVAWRKGGEYFMTMYTPNGPYIKKLDPTADVHDINALANMKPLQPIDGMQARLTADGHVAAFIDPSKGWSTQLRSTDMDIVRKEQSLMSAKQTLSRGPIDYEDDNIARSLVSPERSERFKLASSKVELAKAVTDVNPVNYDSAIASRLDADGKELYRAQVNAARREARQSGYRNVRRDANSTMQIEKNPDDRYGRRGR